MVINFLFSIMSVVVKRFCNAYGLKFFVYNPLLTESNLIDALPFHLTDANSSKSGTVFTLHSSLQMVSYIQCMNAGAHGYRLYRRILQLLNTVLPLLCNGIHI